MDAIPERLLRNPFLTASVLVLVVLLPNPVAADISYVYDNAGRLH